MIDPSTLDFSKGGGLVTVVTQDSATGQVLMVAHADREAVEYTIATGEMHYRSRSRGLWHKGATSGNRQRVVSLTADCDGDAILARVIPLGPACHKGTVSCFADEGEDAVPGNTIAALDAAISSRAAELEDSIAATANDAEGAGNSGRSSYTQRLLSDRNLRLKKLGEEAAELVTACADGDTDRAEEEAADLLYHVLVALRAVGGTLSGVESVLASRALARASRR